ncbi:hypothetical protein [Dyadobacter sp. CY356]|uniref:hypothetical protein n=1 Tax=Dyadobacter sp. CY356 TaxID=2906442 RepID=UPI001F2399CC|nr:hypothetical protein [Dyadobacter sp. CY356]MCF0057760.1 hypothetical protein [Dyadobacter sp. CY356]
MKRTTLTNHIDAFKTEALMLLRFQLAYNRIIKFDDFGNFSRSDFVDKLISLKAIENDLLIRVCKFDDDTTGVHSFKNAVNEISTTHKNKAKIEEKLKSFSKLIDKLKKERRHIQLAHLKIGTTDEEYDIRYELTPAIKVIIDIIDLMNLENISYTWSDGKYEKFDLRKEVLSEPASIEK